MLIYKMIYLSNLSIMLLYSITKQIRGEFSTVVNGRFFEVNVKCACFIIDEYFPSLPIPPASGMESFFLSIHPLKQVLHSKIRFSSNHFDIL